MTRGPPSCAAAAPRRAIPDPTHALLAHSVAGRAAALRPHMPTVLNYQPPAGLPCGAGAGPPGCKLPESGGGAPCRAHGACTRLGARGAPQPQLSRCGWWRGGQPGGAAAAHAGSIGGGAADGLSACATLHRQRHHGRLDRHAATAARPCRPSRVHFSGANPPNAPTATRAPHAPLGLSALPAPRCPPRCACLPPAGCLALCRGSAALASRPT